MLYFSTRVLRSEFIFKQHRLNVDTDKIWMWAGLIAIAKVSEHVTNAINVYGSTVHESTVNHDRISW